MTALGSPYRMCIAAAAGINSARRRPGSPPPPTVQCRTLLGRNSPPSNAGRASRADSPSEALRAPTPGDLLPLGIGVQIRLELTHLRQPISAPNASSHTRAMSGELSSYAHHQHRATAPAAYVAARAPAPRELAHMVIGLRGGGGQGEGERLRVVACAKCVT